jgi:hypothetical protein
VKEIPQEIVDATWQEVARFSPGQAGREMERAGQHQPDLLAFALEFTQDCRPPAHELAVYLYFVILRIFQKATSHPMRPIEPDKIQRRLEQNEELLARLEGAHPRFLERAALYEMSQQPAVVKYLVEAIMEAQQGDDPVALDDEESGTLFLVLKTVVDLLDEARSQVEAV